MQALKAVFNVRKRELPLVLLMFAYFFLVIATFWILKPIKKDVFVNFYNAAPLGSLDGPEVEQLAKVANMGVAFVAVVAFTILSRRYHRHQLTAIFSGFCIVALGAFSAMIKDPGHVTAWTFYLFGDLFNTLMVATFFVFLNDSVKPEDSKRLFGPIVLGGVVGGAVGSTSLRALIEELSAPEWMWVCCGTTLLIALIAIAAGKLVDRDLAVKATILEGKPVEPAQPAPAKDQPKPQAAGNPAVEGAKIVVGSKYLLSIVAIVALYEIVSTILDFQFTATVYGLLDKADAKAQVSTVYAITNWAGLAIQLFATTFILQKLGMRVALLVMPIAILTNSMAYLVLPIVWVGSFLNTSDNAFNYSLNQSAREALWTPTSRDEKYKAKAFIDMFVVRSAKAAAVGLNLAMSSLFVGLAGIRWLSLFVVVLVVLWALAAKSAARHYERLTAKSQ